MPQFFASTAKGLVEPLLDELRSLGFEKLTQDAGGVYFESNWAGCYRANLESRLASRILKPVLDFTAYQPEELYNQIRNHDFTKYINPNQTVAVEATVKECMLRDQRYVALKVKDAVVDEFSEKYGQRPNVDNENATLRIHIKGYKNHFFVSVDTSGNSLFQRGYRHFQGVAPLKENLAAGLVRLSQWDRKSPLVDLMCGSGTILIEAAMMAMNIAPGMHRKGFAFQNWKNYDPGVWNEVVQVAAASELETLPFSLYGYDSDYKMISIARENARAAGVDHVIHFSREKVASVQPPTEQKGLMIMNPPYGIRLGDEALLRDVYRDLGFTLKNRFKGWECWILSGNKDLISDLKLKAARKIFLFNGHVECRFLKYSINQ